MVIVVKYSAVVRITANLYRQGYANLFNHIAVVLRCNKAPTVVNILDARRNSSEWPLHTKNFFQRAGNTESAIYVVFEGARDQDECSGDGSHMDIFAEQVEALPKCRNDHEYRFVALACGLGELEPGVFLDPEKISKLDPSSCNPM